MTLSACPYVRINGEDVVMADFMPLVFINPELTLISPKEAEQEGCLSFPDIRAMITRPAEVKAKLTTLDGDTFVIETDGLLSRGDSARNRSPAWGGYSSTG